MPRVSGVTEQPANAGSGNALRLPTMVTPARLLAFTDSIVFRGRSRCRGTRRVVVHGMRLLERADGTIERGDQLLPSRKNARTLELPKRLGGGFLFYVEETNGNVTTTSVWRAPTWTGKLEPFANLGFDVAQIVAGFDRLYVVDKRSAEVYALDAETGKVQDTGTVAAVTELFVDGVRRLLARRSRRTAARRARELRRRHELASSGSAAQGVSLENGELVIRNPEGDLALDASGLAASARAHGHERCSVSARRAGRRGPRVRSRRASARRRRFCRPVLSAVSRCEPRCSTAGRTHRPRRWSPATARSAGCV